MKLLKWILSLGIAFIFLQTVLLFKFPGAEESVYIFSTLNMEPWGRIGSGIVEVIASFLVLIPSKRAFGALLALGTISGALFFHLTTLGIEVQDDGGTLFYMGLAVFVASFILLILDRQQIIQLIKK